LDLTFLKNRGKYYFSGLGMITFTPPETGQTEKPNQKIQNLMKKEKGKYEEGKILRKKIVL
jgi:hypothetical protein